MYEENNRISWTGLFIKIIIVVIFILFTVWLLSLATKNATRGMSNSLDVLTDGIFSQNVEKMKEVGKSYFTTERLPKNVGDVKKLSLARMYDEGLILEVKDKNGNACSAKNSYVSVEKMDTEYQMQVYLECGEEKDSVTVIMGCYNYCNTDICEKNNTGAIEYEYSRTTGGSWTDWGNWTNWSTTGVSKTNSRDVDTKVVKENYTYDKTNTNSILVGNSTCPTVDGYTFKSSSNGVCTYTKTIVDTKNPNTCPSTSGDYKLVSQNGFTCNYSKSTKGTASPDKCPSTSGDYKLVSQNGFTCNYSKTTKGTTNPSACASTYGEYKLTSQNGFTCNYSKNSTSTINATSSINGGDPIYGQSCYKVAVGTKIVSSCTGCAKTVQTVYETRCDSVVTGYTPTTTNYSCPSGYTRSGSTCSKSTTATTTTTVGCPSGYTKSGNSCVANTATTVSKTTTVTCPSGYTQRGTTCAKDVTYNLNENALCDDGLRQSDGRCYKDETTIETVNGVRDVTYYRYRTRNYTGGNTDYKWSTSNNDTSLINAGYRLTGKTRNIGGK